MAQNSNYTKTDWLRDHWRPMMAMQYLVVCVFDFVLAPILWTSLQAYLSNPITQWTPTTLGSGGFYHISMGAVLGVSAWIRTRDKPAEEVKTEK